jgi:two-component system chemotaxis sensor kinase CheA
LNRSEKWAAESKLDLNPTGSRTSRLSKVRKESDYQTGNPGESWMPDHGERYKLFNNLLDAVLVVNADGNIRYCNGALSNLLNIPSRRLKMETELFSYVSFNPSLFNPNDFASFSEITEATSYREIEFQSKSGRIGQVQVSVQPDAAPDGEEPRWILFFRDVTLEATLHSKYHVELEKKEDAIRKLQSAQKKLKIYSETLEKKVEQRTADLANNNQLLTAIVNSLGQGFIVVDNAGICSKTYSRVTLSLLEIDPSDQPISKVLKVPQDQLESFNNWFKLLLNERLPFDELVHLGPRTFSHSMGKHIALEFHPIREANNRLSGVVVVASDKTNEIQAINERNSRVTYRRRFHGGRSPRQRKNSSLGPYT